MFTKILYPTDFSDSAEKGLKYVLALRTAGAKSVVILNVIHQRIIDTLETLHKAVYFQDGRYQEDADQALEKLQAQRAQQMAGMVADLEAAGFEVSTRIVKGYPVREILRAEQEESVSAIVLGSHGRNNFSGARLGSVSEKIMRRSQTPVLVIKR